MDTAPSRRPHFLFLYLFLEPLYQPSFLSGEAQTYGAWLEALKPRTCLLVTWLASLGTLPAPPRHIEERARRFAQHSGLLARHVATDEVTRRVEELQGESELDIFVAHLLWQRFLEYVPARFVSAQGRARVLSWLRAQLRRAELSERETLGELAWHIERIEARWDAQSFGWS